jgi:hypothetical protein
MLNKKIGECIAKYNSAEMQSALSKQPADKQASLALCQKENIRDYNAINKLITLFKIK